MKRKSLTTAFLAVLLASLAFPLMANSAAAEPIYNTEYATVGTQNGWKYIETDQIKILFPSDGRKPMFLWWYKNDTEKIYVVKYQGLIEYFTFDDPFYKGRHAALAIRLRERFVDPYPEIPWRIRERIRNIIEQYDLYTWHRPFLPFMGCNWSLSGPENITKNDKVIGLTFNFTMVETPFPRFQFANNNIIIRCRFYYEPTTENVDELYNYTVNAGELKMDFIIKHWEWNIDKIESLISELKGYEIEIPKNKTGLALWINLASIDLQRLENAENDPETIEKVSTASNMIVEGKRVSVAENRTPYEDERPISVRKRLQDQYRLQFEREESTLAGFFKFVASAKLIDPLSGDVNVTDVKAAYIAAGAHMRLFLCYPYFGNKTLEHDPSLGLEAIPSLISPQLVTILVGTVAIIAAVVFVARWRKRVINVVGVR